MLEISLFSGKVTLKFTKDQYRICRRQIKRLLTSTSKKKISEEDVEKQYILLIKTVLTLKHHPNNSFYLRWHRDGAADFIDKMLLILPALDKLITNNEADHNLELFLNLGTRLKPANKKFKLPKANSSNFLVEFKHFLLDYYERNPPFKYYRGLDAKLSLESIQNLNLDKRNKPLKASLEYNDVYYKPHRKILETLRKFPQFQRKKRPNSILIEEEGEVVLKLLSFISYDKIAIALLKNENIEILGFDFGLLNKDVKKNIKQLRNDLQSYLNSLNEYHFG